METSGPTARAENVSPVNKDGMLRKASQGAVGGTPGQGPEICIGQRLYPGAALASPHTHPLATSMALSWVLRHMGEGKGEPGNH